LKRDRVKDGGRKRQKLNEDKSDKRESFVRRKIEQKRGKQHKGRRKGMNGVMGGRGKGGTGVYTEGYSDFDLFFGNLICII
jgi:hypothetical protein